MWRWFRRPPADPTVFHVTHPKAGSQWVYDVLMQVAGARIVTPVVGVAQVREAPIRPGGVYPTVYLTRHELDAVAIPEPSIRFVVIRDLRDTLVSLYFSKRFSHPLISQRLVEDRKLLEAQDRQQGLRFCLVERLERGAKIQESWLDGPEPVFRYEDLIREPLSGFKRIFEHCRIAVPAEELEGVVKAASFENRSGRSLGTEDIASHLRRGLPGDWVNHFDDALKADFKKAYGPLLVRAGYERDESW